MSNDNTVRPAVTTTVTVDWHGEGRIWEIGHWYGPDVALSEDGRWWVGHPPSRNYAGVSSASRTTICHFVVEGGDGVSREEAITAFNAKFRLQREEQLQAEANKAAAKAHREAQVRAIGEPALAEWVWKWEVLYMSTKTNGPVDIAYRQTMRDPATAALFISVARASERFAPWWASLGYVELSGGHALQRPWLMFALALGKGDRATIIEKARVLSWSDPGAAYAWARVWCAGQLDLLARIP